MTTTEPDESLRRVLLKGYETKDFDYKGPMDWDASDKKARCELVKDILAMANTLGGTIVLGVSELANGWDFEGVSSEQAKTFDSTKINAFVQNYADPPINCSVHKLQHEGKNFVILQVPQFPDTPHICQKDFPGVLADRGLYMRSDNNESAPLKSSADFRVLIGRAVQNKSDELLHSMHAVLKGASGVPRQASEQFEGQIADSRNAFSDRNPLPNKTFDYFFETAFVPSAFEESRFDVPKLRQIAFDASVDFTGWPFLPIHVNRQDVLNVFEDGIESFWYSDDYFGGKILDFWRLYQSGLFYKKELPFSAYQQPEVAIYPNVAQYYAVAVDCLSRMYTPLLDPEKTITFRTMITGTKGRKMINGAQGLPLFANYTSQIPAIRVERTHSLAEWKAGVIELAAEMMAETQTRFNWIQGNNAGAKDIISRTLSRTF